MLQLIKSWLDTIQTMAIVIQGRGNGWIPKQFTALYKKKYSEY